MAINIRNDKSIKPIVLGKTDLKIRQYADDTVLFLKDFKSLKNTFQLLDNFQVSAGLKLNKEKTEAIILNKTGSKINDKKLGIKEVKDITRSLGLWVGLNTKKINEKNLQEKLTKVKNILNMYK